VSMPSASSVDRKPWVTEFTSAVASSEDVADGLDWQAFSAAYFPGRRRHDFEALTAYDAYKRSRAVDERSADETARWRMQRTPRRDLQRCTPGKTRVARAAPTNRSYDGCKRIG
jgi:hypothetical protein